MGARITGEELAGKAVAGVDTHADTHWLCVPGDGRRVMRSTEFPADADGCAALAEAIGDPDGCAAVGVEGTQPCGAGLVDEPRRRGFRVPGVPGPKREDKRRRGEGKDDGTGAERAARDVIAGEAASAPKRRCGWLPARIAGATYNAEWVMAFQEWVQEQSVLHLAPAFGDVPHTERVEAKNGEIYSADIEGVAIYAIQISVTYTKTYRR